MARYPAVPRIYDYLKDNPEALNLLKWAGILYIIYLAYDTFTAKLSSVNKKSKKFKKY